MKSLASYAFTFSVILSLSITFLVITLLSIKVHMIVLGTGLSLVFFNKFGYPT